MKQSINVYQFRDEFARAGREENFSYEGQEALFDWLESYEEDTGEEIELDVIALCCDFSEYADFDEIADVYDELKDTLREGYGDEVREWLHDRTTVIEFDRGIIIQDF